MLTRRVMRARALARAFALCLRYPLAVRTDRGAMI
jgi:hypothetical protein